MDAASAAMGGTLRACPYGAAAFEPVGRAYARTSCAGRLNIGAGAHDPEGGEPLAFGPVCRWFQAYFAAAASSALVPLQVIELGLHSE